MSEKATEAMVSLLCPKYTTVLLECYDMGTVRVAKIWRKMSDKDGTLPVSDTLSNVCLKDCALLYDYTVFE